MIALAGPDVAAEVERLLGLPYRRELIPNEDGSWFARLVELPGCITEGDSAPHALDMLTDAMRLWLTDALNSGEKIPPPTEPLTYSGKFQVRIPPSLHERLADCARQQGVSINQLVTVAVSQTV